MVECLSPCNELGRFPKSFLVGKGNSLTEMIESMYRRRYANDQNAVGLDTNNLKVHRQQIKIDNNSKR